MRSRPLAWVAAVIGATLPAHADPEALVGPGVVIDSRLAAPGAIFVALPGERVDGHDFADAAAAAGAAVVIGTRTTDALPTLVVPDAAEALAALARAVIAEEVDRGLTCVALTGSSGKTSTKDLLAQVLRVAGPTVSPPGSFNNEIGVPLTSLGVDAETRFLIAEMGARGRGHIAWLCSVVPPRVASVLNVGHAHVGEFGSVAGIAQAKGEIVEALPAHGWAVLNADDPAVSAMVSRTAARVAAFSVAGEPPFGDMRIWASELSPDALQRFGFTLHAAGTISGQASVSLTGPGRHQVANSLAAAGMALAAGVDLDTIASALTGATAESRWRMELHERRDGVLIVNDAYNANPDSMLAALDTVSGMRRPGGRLVAVLGDMLELGDTAEQAHREIGQRAGELGFEVIGVGDLAALLIEGAKDAGAAAAAALNAEDALGRAASGLQPGDVVLVKASRGLALDRVAQRLIELSETKEPA